ncbi:HEPN domain-containing protein [Kordiimonas marina]|uniref:HEPN domain-containing protein n=1 Tax=Kordiimonas marina TaxID=2872312 RepID=UPI001FF307C1|nr:HEPN domain-containing protein [Kordiimonas marina]MCJ9429162.1 hypothetical protein [Kordiimonas marina]
MAQSDLTNQFRLNNVQPGELAAFLSEGGTSHAITGRRFQYLGCIEVAYTNKGGIAKIVGDRNDPIVQKKLTEFPHVFGDHGLAVQTEAIFAQMPIKGFFRYSDVLQIMPDRSFPDPFEANDLTQRPFPVVLQYGYRKSPNHGVDFWRRNEAFHEVFYLLSALIEHGFYKQEPNRAWGIQLDEANSSLCNVSFSLGYSLRDSINLDNTSSFEDPASFKPIAEMDPQKYYTQQGIDISRHLMLPRNFRDFLTSYFALEAAKRQKFLRAAYWLNTSHVVAKHSSSLSYQCLVQAIEALSGREKEEIQECPRDDCSFKICQDVGPTKLFRQFLEKYARGTPSNIISQFYDMRSKLTHGSRLMPQDTEFDSFISSHLEASSKALHLRLVVVRCLVNWLLDQTPFFRVSDSDLPKH